MLFINRHVLSVLSHLSVLFKRITFNQETAIGMSKYVKLIQTELCAMLLLRFAAARSHLATANRPAGV